MRRDFMSFSTLLCLGLLLSCVHHAAAEQSGCLEADPVQMTIGLSATTICVGGSVTFTLSAKDVDSCADPRPMTDEIDLTGWPGNAPQKVTEQDGLFHYEATHLKTYDTPGKYHVAIYADDRGLYKLDPNN